MNQLSSENPFSKGEPIHGGHIGIIFVCALAVFGIVFIKNGFSFKPINSSAKLNVEPLTYEQAKRQVAAEAASFAQNSSADGDNEEKQFAMLNPNVGIGDVLGVSTDAQVPVAEEVFTLEKLKAIRVKLLPTTNAENIQDYQNKLIAIESSPEAISVFGNINESDNVKLNAAVDQSIAVIAKLQSISVPGELEEFHKLKMIYYTILASIAETKLGKFPDDEFSTLATGLFSIMDRTDRIRIEINNKYHSSL